MVIVVEEVPVVCAGSDAGKLVAFMISNTCQVTIVEVVVKFQGLVSPAFTIRAKT